jgi:hypothetical protein
MENGITLTIGQRCCNSRIENSQGKLSIAGKTIAVFVPFTPEITPIRSKLYCNRDRAVFIY